MAGNWVVAGPLPAPENAPGRISAGPGRESGPRRCPGVDGYLPLASSADCGGSPGSTLVRSLHRFDVCHLADTAAVPSRGAAKTATLGGPVAGIANCSRGAVSASRRIAGGTAAT